MKHTVVKLLCLLLSLLLLAGCTAVEPENTDNTAPDSSGAAVDSQDPAQPQETVSTQQALAQIRALGESPDDNYRTWYEIFVYSFCDSDGDGIGDLQGVISKLDYLQELGVNGIWLMPIHPSTSYHKYNVSDYYAIDPNYGTMEDFEALMAACESRGIRVILDLVVNHSGSDHPWFREAVAYIQTLPADATPDPTVCKYVDYYHFTAAETCPAGYNAVPAATGWYYESRFSTDMPDLNLANTALREDIQEIMQFWMDKGVAGFRLDAAKEFYSGNAEMNIEVLHWLQETATAIDPDAYLVAEVWDNFSVITKYYESGLTSIFNYAFGNSDGKLIEVIRGAGRDSVVSSWATALEKADAAYSGKNPSYIDAPFLSNHDVGRIAGFTGRDECKTRLAGAMNILMSGSVFIYYGEELGMVCGGTNDPSFRAPMYWNAARDAGTTDCPPDCTLPEEYPLGSYEEQKADDSSIYNYYRQAIAIRNALPVISHGSTTAETALNVGCVSAQRKTWNEQTCIILMNIAPDAAQVDLSAYADWTLAASLSADGNPITLEGTSLELPAWGVAILLPAG
ncbi:MAG: DUF3459 domain-containing protein [Oscillospiraceae bacterium]|nr:DUF3459 domain-containing protein [Oscillospiraceae bacterium]